MDAALVAFVVVFLAELGDKTQLLALSLATRYRVSLVMGGILVAFAVTQGFAALVGGALGAALPETAISVGAALIFFGFAAWTWRDADEDEDAEVDVRGSGGLRALVAVIAAMTIAELGDKTMLATATLAADRDPFWTWVGGTFGATASCLLGVIVGRLLGAHLPPRTTKRLAAVLFAVFGVLLLIEAVR